MSATLKIRARYKKIQVTFAPCMLCFMEVYAVKSIAREMPQLPWRPSGNAWKLVWTRRGKTPGNWEWSQSVKVLVFPRA